MARSLRPVHQRKEFGDAVNKTDPPVVAFLKRNTERFVWVGDNPAVLTGEVHCDAALHIQQPCVLQTPANYHGIHSGGSVVHWYSINLRLNGHEFKPQLL